MKRLLDPTTLCTASPWHYQCSPGDPIDTGHIVNQSIFAIMMHHTESEITHMHNVRNSAGADALLQAWLLSTSRSKDFELGHVCFALQYPYG